MRECCGLRADHREGNSVTINRKKIHTLVDQILDLKAAAKSSEDGWPLRHDAFELFQHLAELLAGDLAWERIGSAAISLPMDRHRDIRILDPVAAEYLKGWDGGVGMDGATQPKDIEAMRRMICRLVLDFGMFLPPNTPMAMVMALRGLNEGNSKHPLLKASGKKRYADGDRRFFQKISSMRNAYYYAGYHGCSIRHAWSQVCKEDETGFDTADRAFRASRLRGQAAQYKEMFRRGRLKGKSDKESNLAFDTPGSMYEGVPRNWSGETEGLQARILKSLDNFCYPNQAPVLVKNAVMKAIDPLKTGPDKNRD